MILVPSVIACYSQEEFDQVLQWLEEDGWQWSGGGSPTSGQECYEEEEGGWGISLCSDNRLEYSSIEFYREDDCEQYGPIIEFSDFADENGLATTGIEF